MALKEITKNVISYCEMPEDLNKESLDNLGCDVYIDYRVSRDLKYTRSDLDNWIIKTYPELIDTDFLIHIDY